MKLHFTILIILLMVGHSSIGQKIKYKDLFPILNEKNYEEGGPMLIQYLSDPKNQDDANAHLQMGLMLEHQYLGFDIIDDSSKIYTKGDSAIFYFETAKTLINEKELKKNDEYYQVFFRRDLRTGEFGIKVSDVHLDIENKVEAIRQRIANVKAVNRKINEVDESYKLAQKGYETLVQKYTSENELLLSASDDDIATLDEIEDMGKTSIEAANQIKKLSNDLGSYKYQNDVDLKAIASYGEEGIEVVDVKHGKISIWDFESWARNAKSEIRGGVSLFKTLINDYYTDLRMKKSKLKKSENVEEIEFPEELAAQFKKYEKGSTTEKLLLVETYEAKVTKQVDLQINPDLLDSSLIGSQLEIYAAAKEFVENMNILVESIGTQELEDAKKKYPDYIESFFKRYGTVSKYVQEMREWSRRNKEWINNSVEYWTDRNKWGIIATEGEAEQNVPLFPQDTPEDGFFTMEVVLASIPEVIIYGGKMNNDLKGYIGSFGADRIEQWALEYDLPGTEAFKYTYDTIPAADGAISFYVFNANATENNLSAVSFMPTGTLNWAVNVTVSKKPVEFKFDELTQELTILLYPEEKLPLDSDDLGYLVIDRSGNAR